MGAGVIRARCGFSRSTPPKKRMHSIHAFKIKFEKMMINNEIDLGRTFDLNTAGILVQDRQQSCARKVGSINLSISRNLTQHKLILALLVILTFVPILIFILTLSVGLTPKFTLTFIFTHNHTHNLIL